MTRDEGEFREVLQDELRAREAACRLLEVSPGAGPDELKAAYRRKAKAHHPDRNLEDRDAARKFLMVRCAYELLAHGRPCAQLLAEIGSWPEMSRTDRHRLENPWSYFVWWRDHYFG